MTLTERVTALLQMRHALSSGLTYYGLKTIQLRANYDEAKEELFQDLEKLELPENPTGTKDDNPASGGDQHQTPADPAEVLNSHPYQAMTGAQRRKYETNS